MCGLQKTFNVKVRSPSKPWCFAWSILPANNSFPMEILNTKEICRSWKIMNCPATNSTVGLILVKAIRFPWKNWKVFTRSHRMNWKTRIFTTIVNTHTVRMMQRYFLLNNVCCLFHHFMYWKLGSQSYFYLTQAKNAGSKIVVILLKVCFTTDGGWFRSYCISLVSSVCFLHSTNIYFHLSRQISRRKTCSAG